MTNSPVLKSQRTLDQTMREARLKTREVCMKKEDQCVVLVDMAEPVRLSELVLQMIDMMKKVQEASYHTQIFNDVDFMMIIDGHEITH